MRKAILACLKIKFIFSITAILLICFSYQPMQAEPLPIKNFNGYEDYLPPKTFFVTMKTPVKDFLDESTKADFKKYVFIFENVALFGDNSAFSFDCYSFFTPSSGNIFTKLTFVQPVWSENEPFDAPYYLSDLDLRMNEISALKKEITKYESDHPAEKVTEIFFKPFVDIIANKRYINLQLGFLTSTGVVIKSRVTTAIKSNPSPPF